MNRLTIFLYREELLVKAQLSSCAELNSVSIDIFVFIDWSITRLVVIEQRSSFLPRLFACSRVCGRSIAEISIDFISTYEVILFGIF